MLQALFCKGGLYPVFPLKGLSPAIVAGMSTWEIAGKTLMHYVLPVICLSYGSFAALSRFTRSGMLEVIQEDYIRTARSKGAGEFTVICPHAFRNALILMITLFAGLLPSLVGGEYPCGIYFQYSRHGQSFTSGTFQPGLSAADGTFCLFRISDAFGNHACGSAVCCSGSEDQTLLSP